jgi:hypothetical protein
VLQAAGEVSVPITAEFISEQYLVSVESAGVYGKTQLGQSSQPFIYGMSSRFQVVNTNGKVNILDPRPGTVWKFNTDAKVVWTATGFDGGETVSVSVIDVNGTTNAVGVATQTKAGGQLTLVPQAAWGVGVVTVRVVANNGESVVTATVELQEPAAFIQVTEPTRASNYRVGQTVNIFWTARHIDAAQTVQILAIEKTTQTSLTITDAIAAGAGMTSWTVPPSITFTSSGWTIAIAPTNTGARSLSPPFQITAPAPANACTTMKLQKEKYLHDEIACQSAPQLIVAGTLRVVSITFEWLWCIDDRLRINVTYAKPTGGATLSSMSTKKIGPDATKLFQVLDADQHGADLFVALKGIARADAASSKTLSASIELLPFDAVAMPSSAAGVVLFAGAKFETTDPMCKCPYEDEEAPCDTRVAPPCVDPTAPACNKPCEPNDVREKCTDSRFPRTSSFALGADVCSAGTSINVHGTPCGANIQFMVQSLYARLKVLDTQEMPSCDKFWLRVQGAEGAGWIISSSVQLCQPEKTAPPKMVTDSGAARPTAATALLLLALSGGLALLAAGRPPVAE